MLPLLLFAACSLFSTALADVPVTVPLPGKIKAKGNECQSWWGPQLLQTNTNRTFLWGACKLPSPSRSVTLAVVTSMDAGKTWSNVSVPPYVGQSVYSQTTGKIFMTTGYAKKSEERAQDYYREARGRWLEQQDRHDQHDQQRLHDEHRLHDQPLVKKGSNPNCPECIQPSQLPQLTQAQLDVCRAATVFSSDDGKTWSEPQLINVSNSLGPHYIGGGLNHGVQIQRGPHKGRLALARRFDCPAAMGDHGKPVYFHSYVLYSDDDGQSWTVGELSPQGWTETQLAEMRNGSLLLTTRTYGSSFIPDPKNASAYARRRGFARSDDGGATWAEVWYVADRQPEIARLQPTCAQALVSDQRGPSDMYWSHPGSDIHDRANYTLHKSSNGGADWDFVDRIYAGGAGYSDAFVLRDPADGKRSLAMAFQKTFEPPVPSIEGGGYDLAVAYWPLD